MVTNVDNLAFSFEQAAAEDWGVGRHLQDDAGKHTDRSGHGGI